jgi:ubiquinone/menaquinone biosynthesis C-methylase UbiE
MQHEVAREEAVKQWSAHPCGGIAGDETSLAYFLEVERSRYEQQPWQRDHFHFDQYRDRRVLEVGVGLGTDLVQFARAGALCHGIDITDRHLELAARNFALRGLPVTLSKADATRIDYPDGHFDVVYSFGVIHHIPDAPAVLREIHRVTKPGGRCLIALYHKPSLFQLYMVLVRGILLGGLPRLGYEGLLATIEGGADGVTVKPYVKLYNRGETRALLSGFRPVVVSVHQVELGRFSTSRVGRIAAPILRWLEPLLGWYVVGEGVKPA